jgi:hypothetical protein
MSITTAQTLLLVLAVAADGVFIWAYAASNPWWASRVGRALVELGAGLGLILGYGALKRLFNWPTVVGVQLALYALAALILTQLAVAFVKERRMWRRRGQRRHDERAEQPLPEERHTGPSPPARPASMDAAHPRTRQPWNCAASCALASPSRRTPLPRTTWRRWPTGRCWATTAPVTVSP